MSERLVPVPRRARSWQPNPALLLVSTARAFAAAHWDEVRQDAMHGQETLAEEADDASSLTDDALMHEALEEARPARSFSQGGLQFARDDFQPLQIRPFNQPLSELSRQALQRFNAELAAENPVVSDARQDALMVDANAKAVREYRPNPLLARAPFMPDVYEVDEPTNVFEDVPEDAAQDTSDEAEPSELLVEATDGMELVHADEDAAVEAEFVAESAAESSVIEDHREAAEGVDLEAETREAPAPTDAEAALNNDEHSSAELADAAPEEHAQAADDNADAEPAESAHAEPEATLTAETPSTEAAEPEISEADLAQEDMMAPDAIAQAEAEAVDAAVDAAMDAALQASAEAQAVPGIDVEEVARREAEQYQLGYAEGERVAREAMAQEIAAQRTVLEGVTQQLHALLQDPQQFFEPLKRLAVHVAEQVVLQELKTSPQLIEQLIQRCLDELDHPAQGMVVVALHPQDKARLLETAPALLQGMRLETADDLHVGSVRLFANDTVVEDLVEHRMRTLVRGLQVKESAWQSRSALLREAPDTSNDPQLADLSESDDVHP